MNVKQIVTKKSILAATVLLAVCMILPVSSTAGRNKDNDSGNSAAAVLRAGEISSTSPAAASARKASGFDAFNSLHQNSWQATFSAETGRVKRLYGAVSKAYSGTAEDSAREFLKDSHMLFGVQSDLADIETGRINTTDNRRHARFQQIYNGLPVQGSQIVVHSDSQGRVTMVQNNLQDAVVPINQNLLSLDDATGIARDNLRAHLGARTKMGDSKAENKIIRHRKAHVYIWEVTTPTHKPPGLWVSYVDAQNGAVLYRGNEIFNITDGKGRAFINNDEYWRGKYKNVKLYDLFENEDYHREGKLEGLHVTVWDYPDDCTGGDNESNDRCKKLDGDNYAFDPTLKFVYDPFAYDEVSNDINEYPWNSQKSWFDQTAAYYQHNAAREWWDKNVLKKYGPEDIYFFEWFSVPVVVNYGDWNANGDSLDCTAYYTSYLYLPPYFNIPEPAFVYSDDGTCSSKGFGNEDLVNDTDIVRHEYAHAIMDWVGFTGDGQQFGGEYNGYGRAMGEGNSDWYAFLASNQSDIAYVSFPPYGLRSIDNNNRYPDDVDDPDWYYPTDNGSDCGGAWVNLPEEHHTGLIWGGYLFDLSQVLKKKALGFVYPSSFYFVADGGYQDGEADFVDAIRAQRDAELDRTGKNKMFLKAFGAMVSRGFVRPLAPLYSSCDYFYSGFSGEDERDYIYLSAPLKLKTEANMLVTGDLHEYPVEARAGMQLSVKVKSKKIGMRAPIIELYSIDGTRLALTDFSGNTLIKKAELEYSITEDGMYVVRVSGTTEPRLGYYTFQMSVDYTN